MFDLHLLHAIGNGITYYKSNRTKFDEVFPAVASSVRDRMFNFLAGNDISFDIPFTGRTVGQLPIINCELNKQFYDSQGLGNASFSSKDAQGREIYKKHLFTSQEAVLHVYAKEMEGLRVLHRLIHASVLLFTHNFLNIGYHNILYIGSTGMSPENALLGEGLHVYSREIRYACLHLLEIPSHVGDLPSQGTIQIQPNVFTSADLPSNVAGTVNPQGDFNA